jgi:CRISPR-associated protein Csb2
VSQYLCVTIRFADPMFRGRGDGGEPEWPPSPLRVFQTLVAAAAARFGNPDRFRDHAAPALGWLESLPPPVVVAPPGEFGRPFRVAVPNNDMDVVASDWSRRVEPRKQPAQLKTLKTVRHTRIAGGEEFPALHYLWAITGPDRTGYETHREMLLAAARSITHLGWGVDMVAGDAAGLTEEEAGKFPGERWRPVPGSPTRLRVPVAGTLAALAQKHEAFLNRLSDGGFRPVPPLTAFRTVGYRRDTDPSPRPFAALAILKPDASGYRAFDTARRCREVAAMARNATGRVCDGWPFPDPVVAFVHGHDPADPDQPLRGDAADRRFMYLPLPTIEHRGGRGGHVGSIRRVLVAAPPGFGDRIAFVRRYLPGQELVSEDSGEPVGLLNLLPTTDWVLRQYTRPARVWSTVTPVILPGHDEAAPAIVARRVMAAGDDAERRRRVREQAEERTRDLLRTAFLQSGLPPGLVAGATLEWRPVGFRPGVELVNRFRPLLRPSFPSYHVRVSWPVPVAGPLAVGAGRYRGYGVFAAESS